MKTQKRIKQVFICLLALMFLIPLARQADALNYDGSGTSGGGMGWCTRGYLVVFVGPENYG